MTQYGYSSTIKNVQNLKKKHAFDTVPNGKDVTTFRLTLRALYVSTYVRMYEGRTESHEQQFFVK